MIDFKGNTVPTTGNVNFANANGGTTTVSAQDFLPYALRKGAAGGNENLYNMLSYSEYLSGKNNEYNSAEAEKNRAFQAEQSAIARNFNAEQAQMNRDWQEMMSNTAHQRQVKDLKAAGLNPVLSVNGGQGAAVTSGSAAQTSAQGSAQASADTSAATAIAGIMTSVLRDQTTLKAQELNAQNNMAIAEKANALNYLLGTMQNVTTRRGQDIGYAGTKYTADSHLAGTKYAANAGLQGTLAMAEANKFIASLYNSTNMSIASMNNLNAKEIAELQRRTGIDLKEMEQNWKRNNPSTIIEGARYVGTTLGDLIKSLFR